MPKFHVGQGALLDAKAGRRATGSLRRSAVVAVTVGLAAGVGLLSANSALAVTHGSQPGSLVVHPASGASSLQPTWSTKSGCPVGYQGSAEMSEFNTNGSFGSRISTTISNPVAAFSGTLDGNVVSIFSLGSNVKPGQTTEWAVGCYSLIAGTGKVKWVQSIDVTLSKDGKTYSTSMPSGSAGASTTDEVKASASPSSGSGTQFEAASIAGACGLIIAVGGIAWTRRRNRTRFE